MSRVKELSSRFYGYVSPEPNSGCWLWTGPTTKAGYGSLSQPFGKPHLLAHRMSYERFKGPIPEGRELDHLCRVRCCVNPQHLEAVTHKENCQRGIRGFLTTHCPLGHPYNKENTYFRKRGGRVCRPCGKIADHKRRAK